MSGKIIEVGMRIDGDAKGAQNALGVTRSDLGSLATEAAKIKLLDGDSVGAASVIGQIDAIRKDLDSLTATERRIALFDSIISASERAKGELVQATAQVNRLKATLSEAYDSGADNSLIRSLEKQLATAEKSASRAELAVQRTTSEIVRLNLEADKTGVSIGNLAQKKSELAAASERAKSSAAALAVELDKERQYQAYLADETERLDKAERLAKENRFVEETRQASIAAQKAAEYTGWWAAELVKVEKAEREVAARANAVNSAFSTLGIRTAKQIEADLQQINQELLRLAQRSNLSGEEFDRAFSAGQKRIAALRAELKGVPGDIDPVANKASMLADLMKGLAVSFTGVELARQFVLVNIELENIERSFIAVTGSTAKANQEMEYARSVANRLGVDVLATARSYSDLMAATKGSSVEGEITRQVFESVTRSMAIAGRTSAETAGALNALSQMAGKGVVQMEELRGQLGDRLPGALRATADGLGITTSALIKLVESGQMTAEELFPALAAGLEKLYGQAAPTETMSQRWAHFKNGIIETFGAVADTGVWAVLAAVLTGVTEVLMIMATGLTTVSAGFFALVKAVAATAAALKTHDFSHLKEELQNISTEMVETINRVASLTQVSKLLKSATDDVSAATRQATAETAEHNKTLAQLKAGYAFATEAAAAATKQTQASVDARKAESDAALAAANAFGNETQKLIAKTDATRSAAAGAAELAEKRRDELALARAALAAISEEVTAKGSATEAQQKVIDTLQKTVEARQADADKATAQAQSSAIAAAQAEVEANAHADNSGRVLELKTAYEQAALAADVLRAQKVAGIDVGQAAADADLRAGQAAALYRDALADQTASIQRNLAAKAEQINVDQAGIRLAIEQQRTIAEVSRAKGNEYGATQALLQIKRLEIQLAELTAKAKAAEAQAGLELVKAKRAELEASGQMTAAKDAELKAQEAGAKVKQIEGKIAEETAKRMRELGEATQFAGTTAGRHGSSYDALTSSLQNVSAAAGDARAALNDLDRYEREKFTNPVNDGGYLQGGHQADKQVDVTNMLYKAGASIDEAKAAAKYYGELYQREAATQLTGNLGNSENARRQQNAASKQAIEQAIALAREELSTGQAVDLGTSVQDIMARNLATRPTRSASDQQSAIKDAGNEAKAQKTVRLELVAGGRTSVLYGRDEAAVNDFLKTLEHAGMVSKK